MEIGDPAPDVRFLLADGERATGDFHGEALVVYFYPKDDTSGCTREAQDFTALMPEFVAAGASVIGVSRDTAKSHARFTGKYDLAVPLAADADGAVTEAFGVWVEKSLYGRKYMGIERATFLIARDGRIARIWRKVKVAGHADSVLEAVRALC